MLFPKALYCLLSTRIRCNHNEEYGKFCELQLLLHKSYIKVAAFTVAVSKSFRSGAVKDQRFTWFENAPAQETVFLTTVSPLRTLCIQSLLCSPPRPQKGRTDRTDFCLETLQLPLQNFSVIDLTNRMLLQHKLK